jgi:hypothetical protein
MNESKLLCPMNFNRTFNEDGETFDCHGDRCAWWVEDKWVGLSVSKREIDIPAHCAILDIGRGR